MNHRTCLERPTPPPAADQPVGRWLVATVAYLFSDEAPCGKPATHTTSWGKPLCEVHAAELRRLFPENPRLVRPIEAVS